MPPVGGGICGQLLQVEARQQRRPPAGCTTECGPVEPYDLVDALASLRTIDLLDVRESAVALRILAVVPGVRYGGTVTDAVGRAGVVVSLDIEGLRLLVLMLDRSTGSFWPTSDGSTAMDCTPTSCFCSGHTPRSSAMSMARRFNAFRYRR